VNPLPPSREGTAPTAPTNAGRNRRIQFAKNALVIFALSAITYFFTIGFDQRASGTDFPDFYTAARMVLEGHGHQLYDFQAQDEFQARYVGRTGTDYIHPPFETLLYLPFSLWSLRTAYLLWCSFNAAILAYTAILCQRHIFNRWDWRVLLLVFFLFPPVLLNFLQGQDSLFLLLLMTLAIVALQRGRNFAAGCLLGCGLFKFHLILAFVVLVASLRRKSLVGGFALAFVILLLVSAGISGWAFLTAYPHFLMRLSSLPLGGIHPAQMPNIRGLIAVSGVVRDATVRSIVTLIISAAFFLYAARGFWTSEPKFAGAQNLAMGNFVFAAILVSYHLSPHDLCIALLPMGLLSQSLLQSAGTRRPLRLILLCCMCILLLPPLHVILLAWHVYACAGIPILITFFLTSAEVKPGPQSAFH
jgi:Glycosyltransferase family 87